MSESAKDEAALLEQVVLATCECHPGECYVKMGQMLCCAEDDKVEAVLAAIRAAGWAVVPVALMEQAASALHEYIIHEHRDWITWEQKRRFDRDMELPEAIRAMIAAAPGVKP